MLLDEGVTWGDSAVWLPRLPRSSVDLFFTSPPYADARSYARIHPDRYVEWFLPFARAMYEAASADGLAGARSSAIGSLRLLLAFRGQRHPYVYQLVLALQQMGWRWLETYIWAKPNAVPGRYGPRTKDAFEYVYHFARGVRPSFDLDAIRVPYRTSAAEIERRKLDTNGRRNTNAGFGRDRTGTYAHSGADPGNVVTVPQTYNQHYGVAHTAAMPEGLASFFIRAVCPPDGIVIDPSVTGGDVTTVVVVAPWLPGL